MNLTFETKLHIFYGLVAFFFLIVYVCYYLIKKHYPLAYSEALPKPKFDIETEKVKVSKEQYYNDIESGILAAKNGDELIQCLRSINEYDKLFNHTLERQHLFFTYKSKERKLKRLNQY